LTNQLKIDKKTVWHAHGEENTKELFATKIGKVSFASLGGLDLIHSFITDDSIGDEDRRRFEDMGVKVILAK